MPGRPRNGNEITPVAQRKANEVGWIAVTPHAACDKMDELRAKGADAAVVAVALNAEKLLRGNYSKGDHQWTPSLVTSTYRAYRGDTFSRRRVGVNAKTRKAEQQQQTDLPMPRVAPGAPPAARLSTMAFRINGTMHQFRYEGAAPGTVKPKVAAHLEKYPNRVVWSLADFDRFVRRFGVLRGFPKQTDVADILVDHGVLGPDWTQGHRHKINGAYLSKKTVNIHGTPFTQLDESLLGENVERELDELEARWRAQQEAQEVKADEDVTPTELRPRLELHDMEGEFGLCDLLAGVKWTHAQMVHETDDELLLAVYVAVAPDDPSAQRFRARQPEQPNAETTAPETPQEPSGGNNHDSIFEQVGQAFAAPTHKPKASASTKRQPWAGNWDDDDDGIFNV